MAKKNMLSPQLLTLATSQAARFADEIVCEPIDVLELRMEFGSPAGQKSQHAYSLGRNQALTRGKSGYSIIRSANKELNDSDAGKGETSAQLLARRLQ
jgi:hypothetical protein